MTKYIADIIIGIRKYNVDFILFFEVKKYIIKRAIPILCFVIIIKPIIKPIYNSLFLFLLSYNIKINIINNDIRVLYQQIVCWINIVIIIQKVFLFNFLYTHTSIRLYINVCVNLNTIISYEKNGEKHHFMDDYEERGGKRNGV